ncbi:MAG TPA: hypothetical protein CFH82_08925 [Sulfurospirillum sp. UBA12182]|nr:MAG TPA: hypothetical protein CFH82_08925 [Sulfurospirillum sp. UBA12182]
MIIGANNLFHSLKQEGLKEALEVLDRGNSKVKSEALFVQEAKSKSIGDLIEGLLKNVAQNETTKTHIANLLKNPEITKNFQNPTNDLQTLLTLLKEDKNLQKQIPKIENFLLDIKKLDTQELKSSIQNSGVFMESKLLQSTQQPTLSNGIKEILENLTQTLQQTQKNINPKEFLALHVKSLLDSLTSSKNLSEALKNDIQKLFQSLGKELKVTEPILKELTKFETIFILNNEPKLAKNLQVFKNELISYTKEVSNTQRLQNLLPLISTIQESSNPFSKEMFGELKNIIASTKSLHFEAKPFIITFLKLETVLSEASLQDSKVQQGIALEESLPMETKLKEVLHELKSALQEPKIIQTILPQKSVDTITKLIDTLLSFNKFFSQEVQTQIPQTTTLLNTYQSLSPNMMKLATLVDVIKSEMKNFEPKNLLHVELQRGINHLEKALKQEVVNFNQYINQKSLPLKEQLLGDIKAVMLQLKEEIVLSPKAKELGVHVDKILNTIEYHQLNSYATNSMSFYLPLLWQGLDKGEINFKRLKENRFFCEINLELKEYGKIDLMLMLYENKNLNISVFAQNVEFINLFKDNLKELRVGLNKLGLIPKNIGFYDSLKSEKIKKTTEEFILNEEIDMGINIKI